MFEQATTLLSISFSGLNCFFAPMSRDLHKGAIDPEMMDIIIQIIVEFFSILGMVTKEIRQGLLSMYLLFTYATLDDLRKYSLMI